MTRIAVGLLMALIAASPSLAQQSTAELRGRILDAQEAILPGATVTVRNEATGIVRSVTSNSDGTFFISALPPGSYLVEAELSGFRKYSQSGVRLDLGRTTTLDIQLQVGALTEAVTVRGETPLVDLTSKQVGGNIVGREMVSLPSVNGNFVGMVALLPGMIGTISTESFGSDSVSANGMDSRNNNFMLDGANNNDDVIGQRAGSQARMPIEAVQEFQVVTNQYDAELGRTTGAIVNAVSKQGSNMFRGTAAALFQDASMTRRDFFVKQNTLRKPDTSVGTYRANLGGPVVLNKAHFFFNVERVMVNRAASISIPSRPEFNASPVTEDRVWNTLARFDHQLNPNHTWAVRWLRESSPQLNQIVPVTLATGVVLPVTERAARQENDVDQTVVGTLNSVFGNNLLNTVRLNFTQEDVIFGTSGFASNGQDQAALLPTLQHLTFVDQQSTVAQARVNNAYQIDDTVSWFIPGRRGDHDVKLGAQYQYVTARSTAQDNLNGTFIFRTDLPFDASDPRTYPERLTIRVPGALNPTQTAHFVSAFAQDKWRLNNALTLSLGVRYDLEVQPIQERNNPAFASADDYPVDRNNFGPRVGLTYSPGEDGRSVMRGGYGRFFDKTHFELISNIITAGVFSDSFVVQFPTNAVDPGPSGGTLPTDSMLAGGPTVDRAQLSARYPPGSTVKNNGTVWLDNPDRRVPYTDQLTAGYERQVTTNLSASADYIHARARDQLMLKDLNAGLRTSEVRTATVVRPDPNFASIVNQPVNAGRIEYDALQVSLVNRQGAEYSVRLSYTLGYSRGNTSGAAIPTSTFQLLEDLRLGLNEGPTNVDRRHNLVVSGHALVPRTGGLTLGWVARALSGSQFTLVDSTTDPDRNGQFQEPLPAGTYTSATGRNPFEVSFDGGRNGATGPGLFQLDLRAGYRLPVQGRTVEAWVDIFNVTNRANFENPNGDRRSTDFLNLTALRSGAVPTTVQIGVRFDF